MASRIRFSSLSAVLMLALCAAPGQAQLVPEAVEPAPEPAAKPVARPRVPGGLVAPSRIPTSTLRTRDEEAESEEPAEESPKKPAPQRMVVGGEDRVSVRPKPRPEPVEAAAPATLDPSSFNGVQPGKTTRGELAEAWGFPKEIRKVNGATQQTFSIPPFERITAMLADDVVRSIVIYLDKPVDRQTIVRQLQLGAVAGVDVPDDAGRVLGQAYPERGVLLAYKLGAGAPLVSEIVLEPIDAEPFLLRAETNLIQSPSSSVADAKAAVKLEPGNARAHWMLARAHLSAGELPAALVASEASIEADSASAEYRLTFAKILTQGADFTQAATQLEQVAGFADATPLQKARAHCQWGDVIAGSQKRDYGAAMQHHLQAVKMAELLADDKQPKVTRQAAKEVLLEAHLAIAYDIGWGRWQQKPKAVGKWLERANIILEDLIAKEKVADEVRQHVNEQALAAIAGISSPPDAAEWIAKTRKLGAQLIETSDDPRRKAQFQWRLGMAMFDAAQIEIARKHYDKALACGEVASECFEQTAEMSEHLPGRDYIIGRLFYRLGAMEAVGRLDHERAVTFYERAIELLSSPVPSSALVDAGRQGETFVSMAVSFWEVGKRERAVQLTNEGAHLMEHAVDEGVLDKSALAVPYGNLASMLQELGDTQKAQEFAELAAKLENDPRRK